MHVSRILLLLSLVFALACSNGSSVPTLDTGLPRDEPANTVTPAQAKAACQAYEDVANEALGVDVQQNITCTVTGIASELGGGASCASSRSTCLTSPSDAMPIDFPCESATTFAPSGCTATIGQLEDCVNAVAAALDSFSSLVSCDLLKDTARLQQLASQAETVGDPMAYPACASLPPECLDLLGWTDAVPPVGP